MAIFSTSPVSASEQSLPPTPPTIDIRGIVRRHGAVAAVDRVSFQVRRGEFFSILGPSGAGKTSVLRMLAGFEHPDEGEVLIDGRSMLQIDFGTDVAQVLAHAYAMFMFP